MANTEDYGDGWERRFYEKCEPKRDDDRGIIEAEIERLAQLTPLEYEIERNAAVERIGNGIRASVLDKLVAAKRPKDEKGTFSLPHWNVLAWPDAVSGADLLSELRSIFHKYIYAPPVVPDVAALWVVHAWTIGAVDISPFFVLISPTKRCGKTNVLILLMYLTPRSELASNISPSALFRYVEHVKPTLLIDEADSFVSASDELRGILNAGHTKVAANVIRNVEVNGEHLPRRFSVWAAKAIATIRDLADTLEDRSIIINLQRKPKAAEVARLRKRDCIEFDTLRRKALRWATDNIAALVDDPDPKMPDELNDRAADNWRPLIAIADLAGGDWPRRAREAACVLSGAGHEAMSINVECLADIRAAFGQDEAVRSVDLVEALNADPERPWATWAKGKPLTQKHLAGLLKPFRIISGTVHIDGLADAKGYKRASFADAWAAYLPAENSGQNTFRQPSGPFYPSKRPNADGMGTSGIFSSVQEGFPDGSKNSSLSYSHAGLDVWTDKKAGEDRQGGFDQTRTGLNGGHGPETFPPVCDHCGVASTPVNPVSPCAVDGEEFLLHRERKLEICPSSPTPRSN